MTAQITHGDDDSFEVGKDSPLRDILTVCSMSGSSTTYTWLQVTQTESACLPWDVRGHSGLSDGVNDNKLGLYGYGS